MGTRTGVAALVEPEELAAGEQAAVAAAERVGVAVAVVAVVAAAPSA
jgi:hypothetical protein